jgi:hypothetical protein
MQLGKIEFKIIFLIPDIKILFFIYYQIINLYYIGCVILVRGTKETQKICERMRGYRL